MNFPHSDSERFGLNNAAELAIKSHGKPEGALSLDGRKMRSEEHTGIELSGAELAVVKKVIFDWIRRAEDDKDRLERSLDDMSAPNRSNTRDEIKRLGEDLNFLHHNLAERLFANPANQNVNEKDDTG